MVATPSNHGRRWTLSDETQLKTLAQQNTPTGILSLKLGRTEDAIRGKAREVGLPLKPTNRSPYNKRKNK